MLYSSLYSPFSHQIRISKSRKVIKLAGYDELTYFYFHDFDWILHYNLKITIREDNYFCRRASHSQHDFSDEIICKWDEQTNLSGEVDSRK
jgi:hypothetical protein